ncbi:hypothetical protein FKR81_41600 [Lentzea tibetensis]|uniref:OmpA-like domain-containing protein n=1 Tax=Lentzea tibetensis TaxID=2591470 RepID=A0A563EFY1_9PSEU|nr:hypothetical protein [Lentzea tibetensis]TWP44182.1 hypothetical protein FKR81_41600 [Lentzea tibetensis]
MSEPPVVEAMLASLENVGKRVCKLPGSQGWQVEVTGSGLWFRPENLSAQGTKVARQVSFPRGPLATITIGEPGRTVPDTVWLEILNVVEQLSPEMLGTVRFDVRDSSKFGRDIAASLKQAARASPVDQTWENAQELAAKLHDVITREGAEAGQKLWRTMDRHIKAQWAMASDTRVLHSMANEYQKLAGRKLWKDLPHDYPRTVEVTNRLLELIEADEADRALEVLTPVDHDIRTLWMMEDAYLQASGRSLLDDLPEELPDKWLTWSIRQAAGSSYEANKQEALRLLNGIDHDMRTLWTVGDLYEEVTGNYLADMLPQDFPDALQVAEKLEDLVGVGDFDGVLQSLQGVERDLRSLWIVDQKYNDLTGRSLLDDVSGLRTLANDAAKFNASASVDLAPSAAGPMTDTEWSHGLQKLEELIYTSPDREARNIELTLHADSGNPDEFVAGHAWIGVRFPIGDPDRPFASGREFSFGFMPADSYSTENLFSGKKVPAQIVSPEYGHVPNNSASVKISAAQLDRAMVYLRSVQNKLYRAVQNGSREAYSLTSANCITFARDFYQAALGSAAPSGGVLSTTQTFGESMRKFAARQVENPAEAVTIESRDIGFDERSKKVSEEQLAAIRELADKVAQAAIVEQGRTIPTVTITGYGNGSLFNKNQAERTSLRRAQAVRDTLVVELDKSLRRLHAGGGGMITAADIMIELKAGGRELINGSNGNANQLRRHANVAISLPPEPVDTAFSETRHTSMNSAQSPRPPSAHGKPTSISETAKMRSSGYSRQSSTSSTLGSPPPNLVTQHRQSGIGMR